MKKLCLKLLKEKGKQLTPEEKESGKNKERYKDSETLKDFLKAVKDSIDHIEKLREKYKEKVDKEAKLKE